MGSNKKIIVGRLGAPHGVKGEIKIQSFTAVAENLFNYGPLWFLQNQRWRPLALNNWHRHGKNFIATIDQVNDRETAALFTNCDIAINASQLPEASADEMYWHQLQGMQVITTGQQLLGQVEQVLATGANDVLAVSPNADSIDNRQRLLPYISQVVQTVNTGSNTIIVDWDSEF